MTTLITIPLSHFCDKARWALDRAGVAFVEDGHLPLFHYRIVKRAGGKRTVPVLVVDASTIICDSTEIIAWADAKKPGSSLPIDPADRAAALALEDDFDRVLGPATRRWAYYHFLPRKDLIRRLAGHVPNWEMRAVSIVRPIAVRMMKRKMSIDEAGLERSRKEIEAVFERVHTLLRDGRRFLVGDTFSVADLAFAALAAPVLLPREYHFPLPDPSELAAAPRDQINAWRDTAAGRHALVMYQSERASTPRAQPVRDVAT